MKMYFECIPCFVQQALDSLKFVTKDEIVIERALKRILDAGSRLDIEQSPPEIGQIIHKIIREETGCSDPYKQKKKESTQIALSVMDEVRNEIINSSSPFKMAARFSIAGNVMDFAQASKWDGNRIMECLKEAPTKPVDEEALDILECAVKNSKSILVLGDNAGETVFDKLLLEQINCETIFYAVKGSPVINDATLEDALEAGLEQVSKLIENGSDAPGTILKLCSPEFLKVYEDVDLVIAKGQANYETLCDAEREIYFLTQIKCPIVARDLDGVLGDWVVTSNVKNKISAEA